MPPTKKHFLSKPISRFAPQQHNIVKPTIRRTKYSKQPIGIRNFKRPNQFTDINIKFKEGVFTTYSNNVDNFIKDEEEEQKYFLDNKIYNSDVYNHLSSLISLRINFALIKLFTRTKEFIHNEIKYKINLGSSLNTIKEDNIYNTRPKTFNIFNKNTCGYQKPTDLFKDKCKSILKVLHDKEYFDKIAGEIFYNKQKNIRTKGYYDYDYYYNYRYYKNNFGCLYKRTSCENTFKVKWFNINDVTYEYVRYNF